MFKRLAILALLCACLSAQRAHAVDPYEDYATHLHAAQEVTPLTSAEFGDKVSLYNGSTEFEMVDIDVPGNNALPVQLRRHFEVLDLRVAPGKVPGFGDWGLDVPYMEGVFAQQFGWVVGAADGYNRCSNPSAPFTFAPGNPEIGVAYGDADTIWGGYHMHMPGRGSQEMMVDSQAQLPAVTDASNKYPWITKDYSRISCLPSLKNAAQGYPGEGFLAVSPDGTKTYFDWEVVKGYSGVTVGESYLPSSTGGDPHKIRTSALRSQVFLLASRVEDRFGNSVSYSYGTDATTGKVTLLRIDSSDGRSIVPTYTNGVISSATSNVGTWKYDYVPAPIVNNPDRVFLSQVTRPDQSKWTYLATGEMHSVNMDPTDDSGPPPITHCQIDGEPRGATFAYTIGAPFGATATYQFVYDRHGRNYVPLSCHDGDSYHSYPYVFAFVDNFTLHSKQVTGPGLAPQTWTYNYNASNVYSEGYFVPSVSGTGSTTPQVYQPVGDCGGCAVSKVVSVTGPTEITKYTFGIQYARNEGRLLGTEVDGLDGTPLRTTINTYVADSDVAELPFPTIVGDNLQSTWKEPTATLIRPQQQTMTVQDGVTFTNQTNGWDVFANPTSVTRSSSLGFTKTENTTYVHNTTKWVISQVALVSDAPSGQPITENTYDSGNATLTSTKSFGVLQKSYAYNIDGLITDGTLKSVADGLGHTTTLSSWFRGIPQLVTHADTTTESVGVNDAGWITSYTDENSYATGYGYDAMGRVNKITYPSNDTVAWMPTDAKFVQINSVEFGLPAGHWKHIVSTGATRKTIYYDALLRPLLQRDEDVTDPTTIRYTEQGFDAANRTLFTSYPSATASAYNDLTLGTHETFDSLGRPLLSTQDSELGKLKTSYAYLPGFQTQVTSPRGQAGSFSTTTSYQVFDSPDTSHPVSIASPLGVNTDISRDIFGKPLSITRSGMWNGNLLSATRSYVYDANQRLCKRIEPETGATLMDYDSAGNVAWTVTGSALTTAFCDRDKVLVGDQTVHSYDPLNRPQTVTVPGSTPIAWSYYPDGALKTLTSGSGTTANVWTYTYNKRRLPATENLLIDGRSKTISHTYDALGHEGQLIYPSGLDIVMSPNGLGQPTQAATFATGVKYFANGGMSGFTYGNGIVHSLTQNARELPLRSLDQLPGAAAVLDSTYAYDANANVAGIVDGTSGAANSLSMSYDKLDRLLTTNAPSQWWVSAATTYDTLDNIRTNQVGNTTIYKNTFAYDPATWQLSSVKGHVNLSLTYGPRGNLRCRGAGLDCYTFDALNRMLSVDGKEAYQYDGYGRRVKITRLKDNKIDYPVYTMGGQLLTEDDQRTNQTIDYVSLNGSLVAKRTMPIGGSIWTKTFEHTDALHSPTFETDGTGTLTRAVHYTPYGETADGKYVQGPGYTGHVTDAATGLTYEQQRYYDPVLGRFLSVDPVPPTDTGASFNRYWYANNNPYKFSDLDGRSAWASIGNFVADALDTISEDINQLPPEPAMLLTEEMEVGAKELREASSEAKVAGSELKSVETVNGSPPVPAPAEVPHLNSANSGALNHRYEIAETASGDVKKTGVSGRQLNQNGTSPRANLQVNRFNKAAGIEKFTATIKEVGIAGRKAALAAEKTATNALKALGNSLEFQQLPKPKG